MECFAAGISEKRRRGHDRHEHDARVPAARRGGHAHGQPEKAGRALPARRGRRPEHRGARSASRTTTAFGRPSRFPSRGRAAKARRSIWTAFSACIPSLAPLAPLFQKQQLAIVHAAGSPDTTRSHFDAQDFMESGTPGVKATDDGWLNRTLQRSPEADASPFRAVAMGPNLPLTLRGAAPAIALPDMKQFRVFAQSPAVEGGFEALYAQTVDQALRGTGTETFEAIDMLRKADPVALPAGKWRGLSAGPRGPDDAAGGATP